MIDDQDIHWSVRAFKPQAQLRDGGEDGWAGVTRISIVQSPIENKVILSAETRLVVNDQSSCHRELCCEHR